MEEDFITLSEAAALIPTGGKKRPHLTSVWRWARKGVGGIKLRTWRFGRKFVTTQEALVEFAEALARLPLKPRGQTQAGSKTRVRSQKGRQEAMQRAEETCARAGV